MISSSHVLRLPYSWNILHSDNRRGFWKWANSCGHLAFQPPNLCMPVAEVYEDRRYWRATATDDNQKISVLSRASETRSLMNRLGSRQRRDTDQPGTLYLDKAYIMTDYLKFKNTGQHWTCFTKAGWAWHATVYNIIMGVQGAESREALAIFGNLWVKSWNFIPFSLQTYYF